MVLTIFLVPMVYYLVDRVQENRADYRTPKLKTGPVRNARLSEPI